MHAVTAPPQTGDSIACSKTVYGGKIKREGCVCGWGGGWINLDPLVNRVLLEAQYAPRVLTRSPNSSHKSSTRLNPHLPHTYKAPPNGGATSANGFKLALQSKEGLSRFGTGFLGEVRGALWVLGTPEVPLMEGSECPLPPGPWVEEARGYSRDQVDRNSQPRIRLLHGAPAFPKPWPFTSRGAISSL